MTHDSLDTSEAALNLRLSSDVSNSRPCTLRFNPKSRIRI